MDQNPVPGPAAQSGAPVKQGLHPLAWVGIGCGGIALIGILIIAATAWWGYNKAAAWAENFQLSPEVVIVDMIVSANPDLEKVSVDEQAGTVVVRNNSTGVETTWSFADIREGRLAITDDQGNQMQLGASLDELPEWVPLHKDHQQAQLVYQQKTPSKQTGALVFTSQSSAEDIIATYEAAASAANLSNKSYTHLNEAHSLTFSGADDQSLSVQIVSEQATQRVTVSYSGRP